MLHPAQRQSRDLVPADVPALLLTRHSIRGQAPIGVVGYAVPLTDEGRVLARSWGAELGRPLARVLSSPVPRCLETARLLAEGAGQPLAEVPVHPLLVEPGCYVHDVRAAGPVFLELGPVAFHNRHVRGEVPGVHPREAGAGRLLSFMQAQLGEPGTLGVLVTHDTILAAFVHTLLGSGEIGEEDWPWMLEGLYLWFAGDVVHFSWRGETGVRALGDFGE